MRVFNNLYPDAMHYLLDITTVLAIARGTTSWTGDSNGALRGGPYWLKL